LRPPKTTKQSAGFRNSRFQPAAFLQRRRVFCAFLSAQVLEEKENQSSKRRFGQKTPIFDLSGALTKNRGGILCNLSKKADVLIT
jgi:hypothetical protein